MMEPNKEKNMQIDEENSMKLFDEYNEKREEVHSFENYESEEEKGSKTEKSEDLEGDSTKESGKLSQLKDNPNENGNQNSNQPSNIPNLDQNEKNFPQGESISCVPPNINKLFSAHENVKNNNSFQSQKSLFEEDKKDTPAQGDSKNNQMTEDNKKVQCSLPSSGPNKKNLKHRFKYKFYKMKDFNIPDDVITVYTLQAFKMLRPLHYFRNKIIFKKANNYIVVNKNNIVNEDDIEFENDFYFELDNLPFGNVNPPEDEILDPDIFVNINSNHFMPNIIGNNNVPDSMNANNMTGNVIGLDTLDVESTNEND